MSHTRGINPKLTRMIQGAPTGKGVYIFRDSLGAALYVGKTRQLRERLRSYLQVRHLTPKIRHMMARAASVDWMETGSELEAFILESNFIKTYKPPYNVMLKDDKRYPYIRLVLKDPFPYLEFVRKPQKDGSLYYGPYVPAWAVRETLTLLSKTFPLRRCKGPLKKRERPCLNFQMGRCLAPCCKQVNTEEYRLLVKQVKQVMDGKGQVILETLEKQMHMMADTQRFEEAAGVRDQIFALKKVMERQRVLLNKEKDLDFILWKEGKRISLFLLMVRKGMLLGEKGFTLDGEEGIEAFFREFYIGREIPPKVVLVPPYNCNSALQDWLSHLRKDRVHIVRGSGEERVLLSLAREKLRHYVQCESQREKERISLLKSLVDLIGLSQVPNRIEGYDISSLSGREAVGSMVTFIDGEPCKQNYRHFSIRDVEGIDDYAMMREVLRRRLARVEWELPQLILIDGGKGHLDAVLDVLRKNGITGIDVRALAKERQGKPERIFLPNNNAPLLLDPSSPATHLLQRIRDEAHRFGVTHHRNRRRRRTLTPLLAEIPGVGPRKSARLMEVFGGLEAINKASVDDIAAVKGIGPALAIQIKAALAHSLKR